MPRTLSTAPAWLNRVFKSSSVVVYGRFLTFRLRPIVVLLQVTSLRALQAAARPRAETPYRTSKPDRACAKARGQLATGRGSFVEATQVYSSCQFVKRNYYEPFHEDRPACRRQR